MNRTINDNRAVWFDDSTPSVEDVQLCNDLGYNLVVLPEFILWASGIATERGFKIYGLIKTILNRCLDLGCKSMVGKAIMCYMRTRIYENNGICDMFKGFAMHNIGEKRDDDSCKIQALWFDDQPPVMQDMHGLTGCVYKVKHGKESIMAALKYKAGHPHRAMYDIMRLVNRTGIRHMIGGDLLRKYLAENANMIDKMIANKVIEVARTTGFYSMVAFSILHPCPYGLWFHDQEPTEEQMLKAKEIGITPICDINESRAMYNEFDESRNKDATACRLMEIARKQVMPVNDIFVVTDRIVDGYVGCSNWWGERHQSCPKCGGEEVLLDGWRPEATFWLWDGDTKRWVDYRQHRIDKILLNMQELNKTMLHT